MTNPDNITEREVEPFEEYRGLDKQQVLLIESLESKALQKSCCDPFDYALKLRTGEVIAFTSATMLSKDWIHLEVKPRIDQLELHRLPYPAERGMDVRISDIVWIMDAPEGS